MSAFKRAPVPGGQLRLDILAPLKAAQIVSSKPLLPAGKLHPKKRFSPDSRLLLEILSKILDFLPVPDLLRIARVSKRMREMVYDDTRWVQRLQLMGCWDEQEARSKIEPPKNNIHDTESSLREENINKTGSGTNERSDVQDRARHVGGPTTTIFDAVAIRRNHQAGQDDGFEAVPMESTGYENVSSLHTPVHSLNIFSQVHSTRGHARQEFAKIYRTLASFYSDAVGCKNHTDAMIFRTYRDPNQQAQMLANISKFSKSDTSEGWQQRLNAFSGLMEAFEIAVFREFEQGLDTEDYQGKLPKYAQVLVSLNGGHRGLELFLSRNPVTNEKDRLSNLGESLHQNFSGSTSIEQSLKFFTELSTAFNEQVAIIDQVFPPSVNAVIPFLRKVGTEVISKYLNTLFDETHTRNIELYLKAISTTYEQSLNFARSLRPARDSGDEFYETVDEIISNLFEPHLDLYLGEEVEFFKRKSNAEVGNWEKQLSEQDASMQSMYMSNVNRQADKRDFLTSFKKVVMMPVNVLPTFPMSSPFSAKQPISKPQVSEEAIDTSQSGVFQLPTRPSTPGIGYGSVANIKRSSTPNTEPPTTELAAKAAIMNSRLEGIRSLFSIEVALNLVHAAKSSIERAAVIFKAGGHYGSMARNQCQTVFVLLLQNLGTRHIKSGFDQAVDHLSKYNPQESTEHGGSGVSPLVTFLELVNVGDLIQQMIDVFYEQTLVAAKLTDRYDFMDPAVKEKKRFEQMLDERVAAGLNKGIEVLMAEVEYVLSTAQKPEDFNPDASSTSSPAPTPKLNDIGPSPAARQVIELVSSHTKMLIGSTDKAMLDVFNQEVGLRLFAVLCKHLKRQRISLLGAIMLISDVNHYATYINQLRNANLTQYFSALRELAQIYLIAPTHAKDLATLIADGDRFRGIFRAEEVYEFAQRRADWAQVKRGVERAMYGIGCVVM